MIGPNAILNYFILFTTFHWTLATNEDLNCHSTVDDTYIGDTFSMGCTTNYGFKVVSCTFKHEDLICETTPETSGTSCITEPRLTMNVGEVLDSGYCEAIVSESLESDTGIWELTVVTKDKYGIERRYENIFEILILT